MNTEITGRVIAILQPQSFNSKNGEVVKNSFVIEWQDNGYTQKLCLEVVGQDKFDKMKNAVRMGNDVVVRFSVSSREYQGRWFTSTNCFYCSTIGNSQQQNTQQGAPQQTQQVQQNGQRSDSDNLPF